MKKFFQAGRQVPYHPWPYFVAFALANLLLSAFDLSLPARLYLALFGLVLPLGAGIGSIRKSAPQEDVTFFSISWPVGILAATAAVVLRFWDLGRPSWWPNGDEALTGTGALALLRHWNWDLYQTFGQIPTTLSRVCCLWIQWTHDPLFSLQFTPALLSVLTIPAVYLASRQFFSKSFCLLVTALSLFNFWALEAGRSGFVGALYLLWQWTLLLALGFFLHAARPAEETRRALGLGIVLGLGPYVGTPWPVVAFFVFLVVVERVFRSSPRKLLSLGLVFAAFLAVLTPFLVCLAGGGYGGHLRKVGMWDHFSWEAQLQTMAGYLSALFWTPPNSSLHPALGGYMNILLGPFCWLGGVELFRKGEKNCGPALGTALLLFLLPGFLSDGVEPGRICSVHPVLWVLAAGGIRAAAVPLGAHWRPIFLTLVLAVSAVLDVGRFPLFHGGLLKPTGNPLESPSETQQAYEALQPFISNQKPGLVFELIPETNDSSFVYMTYFMNAAWDSDLSPDGIQWASVLTDARYRPFLTRRFPDSRWRPLASPDGKQGSFILGLIPVTAQNRALFLQWRDFYGPYQDIDWEIINLSNGLPRFKALEDLLALYPKVPNDPFLQSCFFEKLAYNYAWERTFHPEDSRTDWKEFSRVFQDCFDRSSRDTVLCEKFGGFLSLEGQKDEARKVFERGLELSPGNPWFERKLKELGFPN